MYIRVTKEFTFEIAHALYGYDGPCKNIHGHSYQLSVTLKGKPVNDNLSPKNGMVVDFSIIKNIVTAEIIEPCDHALILNNKTSKTLTSSLENQKLIQVDFQPTCENLIIYFVSKLQNSLPAETILHHLLLKETSTSYAEWYFEDNEKKLI
ncbi:MAG: 6-carboxytetrahydropterin synthase [Bacteroidia bacterium]